MTTGEILLIVLALVFAVFAYVVEDVWVRLRTRHYFILGPLWAAVPAAVVAWLIARDVFPWMLDNWARGDSELAQNDFVRAGFVIAATLLVGIWIWAKTTDKSHDDSED